MVQMSSLGLSLEWSVGWWVINMFVFAEQPPCPSEGCFMFVCLCLQGSRHVRVGPVSEFHDCMFVFAGQPPYLSRGWFGVSCLCVCVCRAATMSEWGLFRSFMFVCLCLQGSHHIWVGAGLEFHVCVFVFAGQPPCPSGGCFGVRRWASASSSCRRRPPMPVSRSSGSWG